MTFDELYQLGVAAQQTHVFVVDIRNFAQGKTADDRYVDPSNNGDAFSVIEA